MYFGKALFNWNKAVLAGLVTEMSVLLSKYRKRTVFDVCKMVNTSDNRK